MEEERVQLAAQPKAAFGVVEEGRSIVAQILGEGIQVPGGVSELQHAWADEVGNNDWRVASGEELGGVVSSPLHSLLAARDAASPLAIRHLLF